MVESFLFHPLIDRKIRILQAGPEKYQSCKRKNKGVYEKIANEAGVSALALTFLALTWSSAHSIYTQSKIPLLALMSNLLCFCDIINSVITKE